MLLLLEMKEQMNKKPDIILICSFCKKEFKGRSRQLKFNNVYCSDKCYRNSCNIVYELDDKGCHVCISHKVDSAGYPSMGKGLGKGSGSARAHRRIYEERYGKIPKGLLVRHSCDNKRCVNINHLSLGTYKDNLEDALNNNKVRFGERVASAKLSNRRVHLIKAIIRDNFLKSDEIAELFGISIASINDIASKRCWRKIC